jgi:hypothetical protein
MSDRYYNIPRIGRELRETVLFERGFFFTAWCIATTPGKALRQILEGRSHRFQDPVKFLFLCVAAAALIMNFDISRQMMWKDIEFPNAGPEPKFAIIDQQLADLLADSESKRDIRFRASRAQQELRTPMPVWAMQQTMQWMNIVLLMAVPFYALGTWLMFPRNLNLAEHLVVNGYIYGVQCLLSMLVLPAYLWSTTVGSLTYLVVSTIFQFFAWHQVFRISGWFDWMKSVGLLIGIFTVYIVALGMFMFAAILVLVLFQL